MAPKFYVDSSGNYIGCFDGVAPKAGSTEVPLPPPDGLAVLKNGQWVLPTPPLPLVLIDLLNENSKALASHIAPENAGLMIEIAAISAQLKELATLVDVQVYAAAAVAAITNLGVLPDPLESVRQEMLSLCNAQLGG